MMFSGYIFDLDQTLVDSTISEPYRKARNWQMVYSLIPKFILYDGVSEIFDLIRKEGIRTCIVTTAQRRYVSLVANHFNIPHEFIVDYSSTSRIKPYPDPMLKALQMFNLKASDVISFGDRAIDIQASNSAGIKSAACTWGTSEPQLLINAKPNYIINAPKEILQFLK